MKRPKGAEAYGGVEFRIRQKTVTRPRSGSSGTAFARNYAVVPGALWKKPKSYHWSAKGGWLKSRAEESSVFRIKRRLVDRCSQATLEVYRNRQVPTGRIEAVQRLPIGQVVAAVAADVCGIRRRFEPISIRPPPDRGLNLDDNHRGDEFASRRRTSGSVR